MDNFTQRSDNTVKDHKQDLGNVPELRYAGFEGVWEEKYLKEVCVINPKTEVPEIFNYIDLESVNSGILTDSKKIYKHDAPSRAQRRLDKQDILFAAVRPYQQNNYYFNLDGTFVASTGYAQIRAKENSQYLYYFLHTNQFLNEVMKRCTGTSYPAINSNDLKTIKIKIPSINEQEKIASLFYHIDQKIELMEKKYNFVVELKKSLIIQLYPNMNELIPKLRFKNYENLWNIIKVEELGKITTGTTPKTTEKENYDKNGILWITPGDIDDNKYVLDTERKLSLIGYKKSRSIPKNSIFVTCIGIIGKKCINLNDCSCNQQINSITPNTRFDTSFIYYALDKYTHNLEVFAGQSVTPIINKRDFSKTKIITPQLNEQKDISSFLSNIDKKSDMIKKEIEINKEFKRSLLSKMFC